MLGASLFILLGLSLANAGHDVDIDHTLALSAAGQVLNINTIDDLDTLARFLTVYPDDQERKAIATLLLPKIQEARRRGRLANVGQLNKMTISRKDLDMISYVPTLHRAAERLDQEVGLNPARRLPLILHMGRLKPYIIVRTPEEYSHSFHLSAVVFFASFYVALLIMWLTRYDGDTSLLVAVHILTGIAFVTLVSRNDPLRDMELHTGFAQGVAWGSVALTTRLISVRRRWIPVLDYRWLSKGKRYLIPLIPSFALFILLRLFGTAPGNLAAPSRPRVNLWGSQPSELIKLLVVLFLSGYFTAYWERLRQLRSSLGAAPWFRWPRWSDLPWLLAPIAGCLVSFYVLKDLGPAMIIGFVFLLMYAVARRSGVLVAFGLITLIAGFWAAVHWNIIPTVRDRVLICIHTWRNSAYGGEQMAGSLWALASGGFWGSGIGWGDTSFIQEGHNDLILSSVGEEWGFIGLLIVAALFVYIIRGGFRIAKGAASEFTFFVSFGLTTLIAIELLIMAAGVLTLIPLTGVVTPFLSHGSSSMVCNLGILALIMGVSSDAGKAGGAAKPFHGSVRGVSIFLAAAGSCVLVFLFNVQVAHSGHYMSRPFCAVGPTDEFDDGNGIADCGTGRTVLNPRIIAVMNSVPRGDILDRNGLILATSDWTKLAAQSQIYQSFGIDLEHTVSRLYTRYYPLASDTFHLLGDIRDSSYFRGQGARLIEAAFDRQLRGYDTYKDVSGAARSRRRPDNPALKALLARRRDVVLTIDARLQHAAAGILESGLADARQRLKRSEPRNGAIVIMQPNTGDVLALLSYPWPTNLPHLAPAPQAPQEEQEAFYDRARQGPNGYPPGSSFKIVTAIAGLRVNPELLHRSHRCSPDTHGRASAHIPGYPVIHDDEGDRPHGEISLKKAIAESCNAYFAQFGYYDVGAEALRATADIFGIRTDNPKTHATLADRLPYAAFGQGEVTVLPIQMAAVAAVVASGGTYYRPKWVADGTTGGQQRVIEKSMADEIGAAMRDVVTIGTGKALGKLHERHMAGKTGTAQTGGDRPPHSWFIGYAPFERPQIAFAVFGEYGGYGIQTAAPIAKRVVDAAYRLRVIE
jgi:cell division protein FtsI/penicillin-binding protein 2/cell division protein FtsW (lipid II flippase)